MTEERCVSCGDIIPEGRQVCYLCNPVVGLTSYGFQGLVDNRSILFATEDEYYEYIKEGKKEDV